MIADCIENGFGLQNTTWHVNSHLTKLGREMISVSAVYGCIQRLKPKIIKTKTRQQGSMDTNSNWAKAHLNWVLQLQIRFGKLDLDRIDEFKDKTFVAAVKKSIDLSNIPDHFYKTKLTMIDYKRVLWFDEHHRQVVIGLDGITSEFQTLFAPDKNGNVDTTGKGQYCEGKKKLKMKYVDEARFYFGCCYGKNGEGFLCNNFVYTGQMICSIVDDAKVKRNKMERIRSLKGGSYWILDRREGRVWMNDPVTMASGVKKVHEAKLKSHEIKTLG
jgi:hypothetical protein